MDTVPAASRMIDQPLHDTAIPLERYNIRIVETIALAAEQHAHYQMPF